MSLLSESGVNLVVLARYMQVLTTEFVGAYPSGIVNIHHSFLPAFSGADAYRRAHGRGQDDRRDRPLRHRRARRRADHPLGRRPRNPPRYRGDLALLGREVARRVLARAVRWHLEDRVFVDRNRTVVFE